MKPTVFSLGLAILFLTGCQSLPTENVTAPEPAPQESAMPKPVLPVKPPAPTLPAPTPSVPTPPKPTPPPTWLGLQLFIQSNEAVEELTAALPRLGDIGINAIIVETGYHFDFKSHPELRSGKLITRDRAKNLAATARKLGVRLIPELNCLGHQSSKNFTHALLRVYPQFAEPSPSTPDPKTDYLKNWCPRHPQVNPVIFDLIDEIAEAFDADAFHVGMDEVFNLASDNCRRCRGEDPAKLFAKVVNDLHAHIVGEKKLELCMWGDRLLDSKSTGYSKWEASGIGTAGAIDLIPTNIVICDWHYGKREIYPSVPLLLQKGFRVWPAGFRPLEASKAFSDYSLRFHEKHPRVVGYLCTTWSLGRPLTVADWPPVLEIMKDWKAPVSTSPTNSPN